MRRAILVVLPPRGAPPPPSPPFTEGPAHKRPPIDANRPRTTGRVGAARGVCLCTIAQRKQRTTPPHARPVKRSEPAEPRSAGFGHRTLICPNQAGQAV